MSTKFAKWAAGALVALLVAVAIVFAIGSRTEPLRKLVVATLEDRLGSDVELKSFSVDVVPSVTVRGEGLTLRLRNATAGVPPFIQIESFTVDCSILDLVRRPRRFKNVRLEKLVINIPPGGLKKDGNPIAHAAGNAGGSPRDSTEQASTQGPARATTSGESPIVIDELHASDALLRIIPRREGKNPKEFAIHALTMRSVGIAEKMPFTATLTNPIPKGHIETEGTFGPWQKGHPGGTPLGGTYSFQNADLGTIKGIGGILNSKGAFHGELERIAVKGDTHVPDFHLTISQQPVPLSASFEAVVDGTDGDTYLNEVNAQLRQTWISAKGAVTGTKGVKGRTVALKVQVPEGRIEDLLRLAVKGETPLMVGRVGLQTDFLLPPGEADVVEKLQLEGRFDIDAAKFTSSGVQQKLSGMSHRARGRDPEVKAENVASDLSGTFKLKGGTLSFSDLAFGLPGALVRLHGSYGLRSEAISFDGTLRMDATISEAAGSGGVKGFLLKAIDPIFRKKGAGALVPIKVRGTREKPEFGLDVGKILK
jgi:uncharacterized protein involved in outer membrane biogenesis